MWVRKLVTPSPKRLAAQKLLMFTLVSDNFTTWSWISPKSQQDTVIRKSFGVANYDVFLKCSCNQVYFGLLYKLRKTEQQFRPTHPKSIFWNGHISSFDHSVTHSGSSSFYRLKFANWPQNSVCFILYRRSLINIIRGIIQEFSGWFVLVWL